MLGFCLLDRVLNNSFLYKQSFISVRRTWLNVFAGHKTVKLYTAGCAEISCLDKHAFILYYYNVPHFTSLHRRTLSKHQLMPLLLMCWTCKSYLTQFSKLIKWLYKCSTVIVIVLDFGSQFGLVIEFVHYRTLQVGCQETRSHHQFI